MMKLKQFRVTNFRSVMDSGWIDCDDITSLIGINEAGKSNLILALWKLKPARAEGESKIDALHDMPRHMYTQWENIPEQIEFIHTRFVFDNNLSNKIIEISKCEESAIEVVEIVRKYDEEYIITFPSYSHNNIVKGKIVHELVVNAKNDIEKLSEKTTAETGIKAKVIGALESVAKYSKDKEELSEIDFNAILKMCSIKLNKSATSEIYLKFVAIKSEIDKILAPIKLKNPADIKEVHELIVDEMPSFVYYSNYGNLDAEIYLPHAVTLLKGKKVPGFDNAAKVRTLRVLFDFVKLDPEEVLELGKDPFKEEIVRTITKTINTHNPSNNTQTENEEIVERKPSEIEIKEAERNKEARAIKLDSAASSLTSRFSEWWKQGDYSFDFKADGDYFKIWVSDKNRPAKIELHKRSTGLQWFLSFYLVFLVERQDAHKGAILLLDEAGLTLHPLAQRDLIAFFENLSGENQIIHTTHSPFLVDTNNIDRVKVVYADKDGFTVASNNLRDGIDVSNKNSIYAAHAALGLSVSDVILQGCHPIIVEGTSDQYYMNAIKLYLIQNKKIAPEKELVFLPAGGTSNKGVQGIIGILGSKSEEPPFILIDSDKNGVDLKKNLISSLYKGDSAKHIVTAHDITSMENSEVEDIIPYDLLKKALEKLLRNDDEIEFEDSYSKDKPLIPQIEQFATANGIELQSGWKVELAKSVKSQLLKQKDKISEEYEKIWIKLFNKFAKSKG